jgi:hypothetical protein
LFACEGRGGRVLERWLEQGSLGSTIVEMLGRQEERTPEGLEVFQLQALDAPHFHRAGAK